MKQQILKLFMMVIVGVLLFASSVSAGPVLKAHIPFDFIVGSETFQAGGHTVVRSGTPGMLALRSESGHKSAMFLSIRVQAPWHNSPKLVFKRYGNQYFLAQVWDGVSDGHELPVSSKERAAAREMERLARKALDPALIYVNTK